VADDKQQPQPQPQSQQEKQGLSNEKSVIRGVPIVDSSILPSDNFSIASERDTEADSSVKASAAMASLKAKRKMRIKKVESEDVVEEKGDDV
jgi:hypothetical protein